MVYKPVGYEEQSTLLKTSKEPLEESVPNELYWRTDPIEAIQRIDKKISKMLEESEEKLRLDFMKQVK